MLVRHTLLYLPAQCLAPLVQFLSIIIWAHMLAPADLGVVTLVIAIQELAFAAFFNWWSHYALRFIAGFKDVEGRKLFLGTELVAIVVSSLIQCAILLPALWLYFPGVMTPFTLLVTMTFMLTRSLNSYVSERARSEAKIALYTIMQTAGPCFGLLIGLIFLFAGQRTPLSVFAGFAVAQCVSLVVTFSMSDVGRGGIRPDGAILKKAASFGIPVMMAAMLALVAMNMPRFVVENVAGLAAVGIFSVGYGLGLRASSFAVMLVTAGAYPLLVRTMELEGLEAAYRQLSKNMMLVALVVVPVAFGLLAVNRAVVDIMVPLDYRAVTYLVLPCATVGGLLRALRAHTTDQVFLVQSKPGYITAISIVDLVLAVLSSYIGIRLYGIPGAALGPMVSGAATYVVSMLMSRWILGFHAPLREFVAIGASAALMGVIVYSIPSGTSVIGLAARIVLGAAIYVAAIMTVLPMGRRVVFSTAQKLVTRLS